MVRKGDRVAFKPQWQDAGDDSITFTAAEDEDGGRVLVRAELGLRYNPLQVVTTDMLEPQCTS